MHKENNSHLKSLKYPQYISKYIKLRKYVKLQAFKLKQFLKQLISGENFILLNLFLREMFLYHLRKEGKGRDGNHGLDRFVLMFGNKKK